MRILFGLIFIFSIHLSAKTITVSPNQDLPKIISSASAGSKIVLKDGVYKISRAIIFRNKGVTLTSASGKREAVILDGKLKGGPLKRENCVNTILAIQASNVTIKSISVRYAQDHGIHVSPRTEGNVSNVVLDDIHVYDCGQQLIKVNSNGRKPLFWTNDCILKNSLIEFKDNSIMQDLGKHFYTGGLDVHGGQNWLIQGNVFRNIQREGKLMEHGVHMWSKCRGTVVKENMFVDCYRAVGFGMKQKASGLVREYKDGKGNKPYYDHVEGEIYNNFIFNSKGIHLESGIELMNVVDVKVYHNTVVSVDKPFSSIEYRWPDTRVEIFNNLVSHSIRSRNGAKAVLKANFQNASPKFFKNYSKGDLHLQRSAKEVINKGVAVLKTDFDGDRRDSKPDIGADEYK